MLWIFVKCLIFYGYLFYICIKFILNWSYDKIIVDLVFRLKSIELFLFGIMIKIDKLIELMKISWGGDEDFKKKKIVWRFSYFLIYIVCRIIIKVYVCSKISFLKI